MEEPYAPVYVENKLYDLRIDPAERVNLIDRPEYESVRTDMRRRLRAFMALAHEPEAEILPAQRKEG